MIAIETYYMGPTNFRGGRIKAKAGGLSLTLPWDLAVGPSANHLAAAKALATRQEWHGEWVEGGLGRQGASVWVNVTRFHYGFRVEEREVTNGEA